MENPTVQDIFHSFYLKYLDRYTPSAEQVHIPQELRIRSRGTERHSASN